MFQRVVYVFGVVHNFCNRKEPRWSADVLKIEAKRDEIKQCGNRLVMVMHYWKQVLQLQRNDEKQIYYQGFIETEFRAVGHMTVKSSDDGSGGDIVCSIEAKFYMKRANPLQQYFSLQGAFGSFLSTFNYESLKED